MEDLVVIKKFTRMEWINNKRQCRLYSKVMTIVTINKLLLVSLSFLTLKKYTNNTFRKVRTNKCIA